MLILGLDPGIARTGVGVIETSPTCHLVTATCLTTAPGQSRGNRLRVLADQVTQILDQHQPDVAAIERVFFGRNAKTAMITAECAGVFYYLLAERQIPTTTFIPHQIKLAVTGQQRASKQQVHDAVVEELSLSSPLTPDDTADAVATALTLAREPDLLNRLRE